MRLTFFLTLFAVLNGFANSYGQNLSLKMENASLEELFTELRKQTGYRFIYTKETLKQSRPVQIKVKDQPLKAVLDMALAGQPLRYNLVGRYVIIKEMPLDPVSTPVVLPVDITGRVTDDRGQPLAGATILVKSTGEMVSTDKDGRFTLSVPAKGTVLVITNIGFERREVTVTGEQEFDIRLKPRPAELEDVLVKVNTGYQVLPGERSTGSFTHVNNTQLNKQAGINVLDRLRGIANGVLFDNKRTNATNTRLGITIRGLSTIQASKDPLVILDNFPYEGDINNINPNDIESITVLKDAAAASIWGAKAGNGVIVINTKKGQYNQPLRVNVSSNITYAEEPDLFNVPQMSSSDFVDNEIFLFSKRYRFGDTASRSKPAFSEAYEILFKRRNGLISAADSAAQIDALRTRDVRNDFKRYMYRPAFNQQYAISMSGGSQRMNWLFSTGYDFNRSELDVPYKRLTLNLVNNFMVGEKFSFSAGMSYFNTLTTDGNPAFNSIRTAVGEIEPYTRFADENGNPVATRRTYRLSYLDTAGAGKLLDWQYYPLTEHQNISNKVNTNSVLINLGARYDILPGLNIDLKYRYERQWIENTTEYGPNSFFARDYINTFTQLDYTSNKLLYKVPKGGIWQQRLDVMNHHSGRVQLNFEKQFNHSEINWIGGAEIRQVNSATDAYRTYGYNSNNLGYQNLDLSVPWPTFVSGGSTYIPDGRIFDRFHNRYLAGYSNLGYSYMKKYTITLSARKDASNLFGVNTNNKWNPLWSTGMSWQVSNEKFYKLELIPFLKMNVSYGYSGNIDPSQSGSTTIRYTSTNPYLGTQEAEFNRIANPDLRWEKVGQLNIGISFRSRNDRITGTIEYFKKTARDLLAHVPIDYTVGLNRPTLIKNVGRLNTSGVDIFLNTINIKKKFSWTTSLVFNLAKDRLKEFYNLRTSNNLVNEGSVGGVLDRPLYNIYSYAWGGLDPETGDPLGQLNGKLSNRYDSITHSSYPVNNLIYHGTDVPQSYGSITNTFRYGKISLSATMVYRGNYYFRKTSINYYKLFAQNIGHNDYGLRWQQPGDETRTFIPSRSYPANTRRETFYERSSVLVSRADNLRLQFINLTYSPSIRAIKYLNSIELFAIASNLGLLWKKTNFNVDPDYQGLRPLKSYTTGIRLYLK